MLDTIDTVLAAIGFIGNAGALLTFVKMVKHLDIPLGKPFLFDKR